MSKVYIVNRWIGFLKRFKIQEVFTSLEAAQQYIVSESNCDIPYDEVYQKMGDYYITEKEVHLNMNSLNKAKYFRNRATALAKLSKTEKELLGLV